MIYSLFVFRQRGAQAISAAVPSPCPFPFNQLPSIAGTHWPSAHREAPSGWEVISTTTSMSHVVFLLPSVIYVRVCVQCAVWKLNLGFSAVVAALIEIIVSVPESSIAAAAAVISSVIARLIYTIMPEKCVCACLPVFLCSIHYCW